MKNLLTNQIKAKRTPWRTQRKNEITAEEYLGKIKETGRQGLTRQTRDLLKVLEAMYGIYWERNQQGMGSKKGRPDFEVLAKPMFDYRELDLGYSQGEEPVYIFIELKVGKRKLTKEQEREKERIARAAGLYYVCHSIEEVAKVFWNLGYRFELD